MRESAGGRRRPRECVNNASERDRHERDMKEKRYEMKEISERDRHGASALRAQFAFVHSPVCVNASDLVSNQAVRGRRRRTQGAGAPASNAA